MVGKVTQFFLILVGIIAVLGIFSTLTNSFGTITSANMFFLAIACFFFILSILAWVFSWAFLLKKSSNLPFKGAVFAGFSSVYASIDPFQFGADAMRALLIKNWFNAPYSDSLAASMITKGLKFLLMALFAGIILLFFVFTQPDAWFTIAFFSGFVVILAATLLFLLPMHKKVGFRIAGFFRHISKFWKKFLLAEKFFRSYSEYLCATSKKAIIAVFIIVSFSLFFEFLSLLFSFEAVGASVPIELMAVLFIIAIVLDRAPFVPRGIGLVESIGFSFVLINVPSIPEQKIAGALVLFAIARIVVPTILSFAFYIFCANRQPKKEGKSPESLPGKNKNKKPEKAVEKNNSPNN
ncbi:MAG: lysylphosphatidylglycerol synthase transmembrane domain-containing protein [Candidatus ainarchaeum sp.]|nr:lysylphosphatidylglycerol synthase transmembrane domain-containing protein [Candidatus ainarchaeum sp.]